MPPETASVTVAVDAVGGDHAPETVLDGVRLALAADSALRVALTGPITIVGPFAESHERVEAVGAEQIVRMDEHAASAVRSKKDSSIVVGCALVRDGRAAAFFSAGNTGACMAAATLVIGRAEAVQRPAIATVIPTPRRPVVLLDAGANADCRPEHLLQFAHMGIEYARVVLGVESPSVGLLNIGEEPTKGSQLAQDAHVLLSQRMPGFVGNIEGRDLPEGVTDIVVTDGFTGNVALKLLEGMSRTLLGQVKAAMMSSLPNRLAGAVLAPSLRDLKDRLDPDTYGGAPLLGVSGVCIVAHGSSEGRAVANGIAVAARAARGDLASRIAASLAADAA